MCRSNPMPSPRAASRATHHPARTPISPPASHSKCACDAVPPPTPAHCLQGWPTASPIPLGSVRVPPPTHPPTPPPPWPHSSDNPIALAAGLTNFIPIPPNTVGIRVCCFPSKQLSRLYRIGISPDSFEPWPYTLAQTVCREGRGGREGGEGGGEGGGACRVGPWRAGGAVCSPSTQQFNTLHIKHLHPPANWCCPTTAPSPLLPHPHPSCLRT